MPAPRLCTPGEYLAFERASEDKHEYVNGRILPAMRVTLAHMEAVGGVFAALHSQLRKGPCSVYVSRMRVRTHGGFVYPDVLVVCGEHQLLDAELDTLLNPVLVVEVFSPASEAYDRGEKFQQYRTIETLHEYVLIAQDQPLVERYVRNGEFWTLAPISGLDASVELTSVGCTIPLADIYENVDFPAPAETQPRDG